MAKLTISTEAPSVTVREQSTISFPYVDLDTAIEVARAILDAGARPLTRDQLAGLLKMSFNSGAFLNKMAGTRMFGLITQSNGMASLTELAFRILDSDEERAKNARAEAFLNIPLFKKVYEEFRGKQLPPRPHGLEQAFVNFGVSSKQKSTARGTFDRSAQQAGYYLEGKQDRLIAPILRGGPHVGTADVPLQETPPARHQAPLQSTASDLHPFIQGLINALPVPGTEWAMSARANWLQAAANNFNLMYKGDGTITVLGASPDALKVR